MISQIYPQNPGSKDSGDLFTSAAAAKYAANSAELTREQCLSLLLCNDLTADEIAVMIRKDVHNVRSRCSELCRKGLIFMSGEKRENENGLKTKVWTTKP